MRRSPNSELDAERAARSRADRAGSSSARPTATAAEQPRWLAMLRSLFCGIYTVDNMDFVLRDAFMSGYSKRAFDLDRLLRYSFFSAARADDPSPRARTR